jgi:ABC-type lipoprotein export system ATPase subunit
MTAAVELRDAFRIYESESGATVALQGLDLALQPGEIVVVLGPSGAGKSTLLRVLAGLERLSAGTARVFGTDPGRLDRAGAAAFRAAQLGLLDQHYARSLSTDLTCRHTVALQLELLGNSPEESRSRAGELLDRVGLLDRADEHPDRLSGGEQQRVAVCAAVAHRPGLLLADEPAGELDAENASIVYRLLGELVRAAAATALIVSHDTAAASIADRLVYIRDGRIVEQSLPGHKPFLVISRKGWARLPQQLAGEPGKPRFAEATGDAGRIVLTSVAPEVVGEAAPAGHQSADEPPATTPPGEIRAELRGVAKRYTTDGGERTVLANIDRGFRSGVFTGLVGRSGSGKTTLLHLLAGLDRPSEGDVTVSGRRLGELSRSELADLRRREIALVTQEPGLIPYLSALENVELGIRLRTHRAPNGTHARAALIEVGLEERLDQRASDLSAGERERVAIARALAAGGTLLLVDEPTARLDEENARAIGALLARAAHERGLAVVCATHDPVLIELMDETMVLGSAASANESRSPEVL